MEIKVVNAGNCMICGKPIKLAVSRGSNKLPDIFFCKECELKLMTQLVHRPNFTAYGRGYKDGFNDGMNAEFQKQVYEKTVERTKKSCQE